MIMRRNAGLALFTLVVGLVMAYWSVLFFNHWYFASDVLLKVLLLVPLSAMGYGLLLLGSWRQLWLGIGVWWLAVSLAAVLKSGSLDISRLEFVYVLDFEVLFVFIPMVAVAVFGCWRCYIKRAGQLVAIQQLSRELKLRSRMRCSQVKLQSNDEGSLQND